MPETNLTPVQDFHTILDILQYRAQTQPNRLAYTFLSDRGEKEAHLTYLDLHQRAWNIGTTLRSIMNTGERVLLLLPPGLDYIAAFFGCLYAGGIAVPCYPPQRHKLNTRLKAIQADSQARFVLTTAHILENLNEYFPEPDIWSNLKWLATDTLAGSVEEKKDDIAATSAGLAFLQYTSGSTSIPKGVMVSHANLMHNLKAIQQCFETTSESRAVVWLPPYHDMGLIGGILQPLYAGFSVVLLPAVDFVSFPYLWLKTISRYHGTASGGPNFAFDLCARITTPEQKTALDLSSWTVAFNGAEPIRSETLERFVEAFEPCGFRRDAFLPCYGLAEVTLIVSGGTRSTRPIVRHYDKPALLEGLAIPPRSEIEQAVLVGCGQCLPEHKIIIANPETRKSCLPDQVGEIWVTGPSVAQGYWDKSNETKEGFRAFLIDTGEGPFLRTGDLGFIQDGELFVTGRIKDMIIVRGRNYYPQDIELTVEQSHPALQPGFGAVFSLDSTGDERLVIVYELKLAHRKADIEEIAQAVRLAVKANHGLNIDTITFVQPAHIPKTSSGKIQRYRCRAMFLDGSLSVIGSNVIADAAKDADHG